MEAASDSSNAGLLDGWLDLWNGDYERAGDLIRPDFRVHAALLDGGDGSSIRGPEGLVEWISGLRAAFHALRFSIEVGPIVKGDLLALRWRAKGSYAGGFPGAAAAAGTPVDFSGADLLRVDEARLAEYWVNSDVHVLLAQLQVGAG